MRTHTCGALRLGDVGRRVRLCGWIQRPRVMGDITFVPLRDRFGTTQLLVPEAARLEQPEAARLEQPAAKVSARRALAQLPVESVVSVEGVVQERPPANHNVGMCTGAIEVCAESVAVLNEAARELPFTSATDGVNEELRLRYRYLDLRRPRLQRNLVARCSLVAALRESLLGSGFLEVETPTLFKSTPEGALHHACACWCSLPALRVCPQGRGNSWCLPGGQTAQRGVTRWCSRRNSISRC